MNSRFSPASFYLAATALFAATAASILAAPPEDISARLETIRAKHATPALAAAAVRAGELVAIGATGVRKFGSAEAVTIEDRWHLGSCTKSMTATLAAILVEDKRIEWGTTVAKVFPELQAKMDEPWRTVTLEQLLSHRAGAPGKAPSELWAEAWKARGTPLAQRLAFVKGLVALPPEAPPGSKYIYSNQGYAVAGAMLERVMKQPWEELLRARLFGPLQMTSAGFGAPGSATKMDQPWGHAEKSGEPSPIEPGPQGDNPAAIGPGGTVHASIGDFARYAGWHARGASGGRTLLGDASFTRLHRAAEGQDYAMGWAVAPRPWAGGLALSHTGSNTMWYCVMWIAPEKDAAFVAATNIAGRAAEKACDEAIAGMIGKLLPR